MKIPLNVLQSVASKLEAERSCGTCTACCVLPRIHPEEPAFPQGKAGYTPCKHLVSACGGCGIYEERPSLCQAYSCLWRMGIIEGDERRRPDNLGLMFTVDTAEQNFVIEAWELWTGAASQHPGIYILDAIKQRFVVCIRFYGVPASIEYKTKDSLEFGAYLSKAAIFDPLALADWCERCVKEGKLEAPDSTTLELDLEPLRRGVPVAPYYRV